jgi:hypothetical protein
MHNTEQRYKMAEETGVVVSATVSSVADSGSVKIKHCPLRRYGLGAVTQQRRAGPSM